MTIKHLKRQTKMCEEYISQAETIFWAYIDVAFAPDSKRANIEKDRETKRRMDNYQFNQDLKQIDSEFEL